MNTDNTKQLTGLELVKKLNSERTQGKWFNVKDTQVENEAGNGIADFEYYAIGNKDEYKANAAYTALAVNHFADVVEALENFVDKFSEIGARSIGVYHEWKEAQRILNSIKS